MSTAVAHAPITAAMEATRAYTSIQPSGGSSTTPSRSGSGKQTSNSPVSSSEGSTLKRMGNGKPSPTYRNGAVPKVVVKKEPSSPEITTRHRPRRLDLSLNMSSAGGLATNGEKSAGLALKDVGLACLSPGFQTHDPSMREQLQRSMDVREQQRLIIEARQKGQKDPTSALKTCKTPGTSRRKGPPPGLSIAPPSHEQFANERVIQSAPLNHTFTGLRQNIQPLTRHIANQPASLSHTSHIHHVPANQTSNRLPPISDVFASELNTVAPQTARPTFNHSPGRSHPAPARSPGLAPSSAHHQQHGPSPQTHAPQQAPRREYRSAEEAVQSMSGGREDLLPRIVHYGGHQPPTPPSPVPRKSSLGVSAPSAAAPPHQPAPYGYDRLDAHHAATPGSARRRPRDEYERDMGTPPLGRGPEPRRAFGEGRDSPESVRRKKEEFLRLCDRAWDLFHS